MQIIFEGVDASGKSTLVAEVQKRTGLSVKRSEGPEKYPGEIEQRVLRYLTEPEKICDRHPAVSHNVYCTIKSWMKPVSPSVMDLFNAQPKIFVYCRPDNPMTAFSRHTHNGITDEPEHLAAVEKNYFELLRMYDQWAVENAHIVYRLGQQFEWTVSAIVTLWSRFRSHGSSQYITTAAE